MTLWYIMRATGLVALALLTVTVALGIAGALRWERGRWTRTVTTLVHRNASLLAVVFLAIHITTAVLDTYVSIPWLAVVVPGLSDYRPLWVALGTVAFDLVLALVVTSFLRARLGRRSWQAIHWLAYAAWPLALSHAIWTGTDTGKVWTTVIYAGCGALVATAVVIRVLRRRAATDPGAGRPRVVNRRPEATAARLTRSWP
jgi:methionine sulfoxide reductase heme-binding subunit